MNKSTAHSGLSSEPSALRLSMQGQALQDSRSVPFQIKETVTYQGNRRQLLCEMTNESLLIMEDPGSPFIGSLKQCKNTQGSLLLL